MTTSFADAAQLAARGTSVRFPDTPDFFGSRMPVRLRYAFHGNWVNKDERG